MEMALSSPNKMVWNYSFAVRRAVARAEKTDDPTLVRQDAATVIFLCVTLVESFLNCFFRVLISEGKLGDSGSLVARDLIKRKSLARKITEWLPLLPQVGSEHGDYIWSEFEVLRELRNKLMHFQSSHETLELPGLRIEGLSDTSTYDQLDAKRAAWALGVAESVMHEVFVRAGQSETQRRASMHLWTGLVVV